MGWWCRRMGGGRVTLSARGREEEWRHPWFTEARSEKDEWGREWRAYVQPGLVNAGEAYVEMPLRRAQGLRPDGRSADERASVDVGLTDDPAPYLVLGGSTGSPWRNPLRPEGFVEAI